MGGGGRCKGLHCPRAGPAALVSPPTDAWGPCLSAFSPSRDPEHAVPAPLAPPVPLPQICKWNLRKLAEALDPTLPQTVSLPILEAEYDGTFRREYEDRMLQKLGFLAPISREEDLEMLQDLLSVMESTGADWTDTFRALARVCGRCGCGRTRLATSVCQLRHDRMGQGPTEPHAGRSTFLLSSGGAGGGYY